MRHPCDKPMLDLCDNQALLKAVKRWVGEGAKATLVGALDADILWEAIKELWKRTTIWTATFLIKVKAHWGEPANEESNKAISSKDVPMEWQNRIIKQSSHGKNLVWKEVQWTFEHIELPAKLLDYFLRSNRSYINQYEDQKSTCNSRVRKAMKRRSAEDEVRKHQNRVTRVWKHISKQIQQVDVSCDQSMVTDLQHGTWMDEERFKKTSIKEKEKSEAFSILSTAHG